MSLLFGRCTIFVISCLLLSMPQYCFTQTIRVCALTLSEAPSLRGARLGVSPREISESLQISISPKPKDSRFFISRLTNGFRYKTDDPIVVAIIKEKGKEDKREEDGKQYDFSYIPLQLGESELQIAKPSTSKPSDVLNGVRFAEIGFYKGNSYKISFLYETDAFKDISLAELASAMSVLLGVPEDSWRISQANWIEMECSSFKILVFLRDKQTLGIELSNTVIKSQIYTDGEETIKKLYDERRKKAVSEKFPGFKP